LVSRVKALLARSAAAQKPAAGPTTGQLTERGKILGMLGAKGGLGVTTMALNLAVTLAQSGQDVILCELRPGQGSLSLQLGLNQSTTLAGLLSKPAADIHTKTIESLLVSHGSGLRLLLASCDPNELALERNAEQALELVRRLAGLTKFVIVDLTPGLTEINKKVLAISDRPIMIVEPMRVTLTMARAILDELDKLGVNSSRFEFIMVSKVRSSLQMPWQQAEAMLNHSIASVITAAPELAYQASEGTTPMVQMQADGLTAEQTRKLADLLTQKSRAAK
jgi:pilus assembly protein CpaE